eukprot:TRINITY_DN9844_c0_g1_i1.p1 TRINITY_DN9844_c0_g1~~TRINITY_DN9844_c0_g1_i1.p1  ORF type:complete len:750 (-),score=106.34 TRINITY_DN9844_c0_g1_i1:151-2349(-)
MTRRIAGVLFLFLLFEYGSLELCNNGIFNLCDLRQPAKSGYTISSGPYDYVTNIAAPLNRTTEECSGIQKSSVGFQQLQGKKQCYSLGDVNFQTFTFINNDDPTKGVRLSYRGGVEGRSMTITLPCDPSMVSPPAIKKISEPYRLNYDFEFYPLKAACPLTTSVTLPYTNDLIISASTFKVFRIPVDSSMVSLKIDLSLGSDLAKRAIDDSMSQVLNRYASHEFSGNNIFIYTKRGKIPTFYSNDYSTTIAPGEATNHRTLFIRGNPYLDSGDIYVSLYGGSRLTNPLTVHLEAVPQTCINCNARGVSDCKKQVCKCEYPYIYDDCSGELKNITTDTPLTQEDVGNNFWNVYQFQRRKQDIFFNVILESSANNAPIIFVSQGGVPTTDNYLASDGYDHNRPQSNSGSYHIVGIKERHLSIEVSEDSDPNLFVGVFGGTRLQQDSQGGVLDRTNITDYRYSVTVEGYACKNNCSGPTAGRCNPETHKCHCHSGYAGKSCSIHSKQLSVGSSKDFVIPPGNFEYFETTPRTDVFLNISITTKDSNHPLKDVVIYVGDGYLPSSDSFYASSHKPDQNEEFVGEMEVEEGLELDSNLAGGADVIEDLRYSLTLSPRKKRVKYFIAVWNRDPVHHSITLNLNSIDYKGGMGSFDATLLSLVMIVIGITVGIAVTIYRDHLLIYAAKAQGKIRTATARLPFFDKSSSFNPSTKYANVASPDDDDNLFLSTDEADDSYE